MRWNCPCPSRYIHQDRRGMAVGSIEIHPTELDELMADVMARGDIGTARTTAPSRIRRHPAFPAPAAPPGLRSRQRPPGLVPTQSHPSRVRPPHALGRAYPRLQHRTVLPEREILSGRADQDIVRPHLRMRDARTSPGGGAAAARPTTGRRRIVWLAS